VGALQRSRTLQKGTIMTFKSTMTDMDEFDFIAAYGSAVSLIPVEPGKVRSLGDRGAAEGARLLEHGDIYGRHPKAA
jgi:hypothetical protein